MRKKNGKKKPLAEKEQMSLPEKVWKTLDQIGEYQKQARQEMKDLREKQERTTQDINKLTQNINKLSGDWDSRWGRFVENLVSGNLKKILKGWSVSIKNIIIKRNVVFFTASHQQWEFDILVINSTNIFVIEVKSTLTIAKIDHFIKQLQNLVENRDDFPDKKIYAAIAYLGVAKGKEEDRIVEYAQNQGLYVICAAGDAAKSVDIPQNFKPRIFSKTA